MCLLFWNIFICRKYFCSFLLIICSRYTFSTTFLCRFFNIRLCFQLFGNILFPCVSNGLFLCFWNSGGGKSSIFSCFRCGYGRLLLDTVFDFGGFVLFYVISLCFDGICGFISRLAFHFLCPYICFFSLNLCRSLRLRFRCFLEGRNAFIRLYAFLCFRGIICLFRWVLHLRNDLVLRRMRNVGVLTFPCFHLLTMLFQFVFCKGFALLIDRIGSRVVCTFNLFGSFNLGSLRLIRLPCFKLFINSISDKSVFRYGFNILDRFGRRTADRFRSVLHRLCCSFRLYFYIFFTQSISPPSRYFLRFLSLYIFSSAYRIISSMVLLYFSLYWA